MKAFLRTYGLILLVILGIIIGGYWYLQNRTLQGIAELDATQVAELVKVVGKHVVLPEPLDVSKVQVAGVQDAEKLMQVSQFFREAQNGDQLIIFPTKLVLFRPSENKIVNISAPSGVQESSESIPDITKVNTEDSSTEQKVVSRTLTVEIRNGSGKTGLAGVVKGKLATFPQLSVSKTGNAAKDSYETTVIVNKENFMLPDISSVVKGSVQMNLPEGEKETTADILIILGKDAQ